MPEQKADAGLFAELEAARLARTAARNEVSAAKDALLAVVKALNSSGDGKWPGFEPADGKPPIFGGLPVQGVPKPIARHLTADELDVLMRRAELAEATYLALARQIPPAAVDELNAARAIAIKSGGKG